MMVPMQLDFPALLREAPVLKSWFATPVAAAPNRFPGLDGFLGTRASWMMDTVAVALVAVLAVLAVSLYLARYRRQFPWHKRLQTSLGIVLLLTIVAFEFDTQFISPWRQRAAASPYYSGEHLWTSPLGICLLVHLCFSVPTTLLWGFVIVQALRKFPSPAAPAQYSHRHAMWGRLAAFGMLMTAVTGWLFYWLAFVAA